MEQVGVRLHPGKTRIVYCKDGSRRGSHEHTEFTFLGFTFRARGVRSRHGNVFTGFGPAASKDAIKKMSEQVKSWRLHRLTGHNRGNCSRDQPGNPGLDAVLRKILQIRVVSAPLPHQCVPGAVDAEKVSADAHAQESGRGVETADKSVPHVPPALAVGP